MSETGEVIAEKDSSKDGRKFDAFANSVPQEETTILHAKKILHR